MMTTLTTSRALVLINGDDTHHDLISAAGVMQQIGIEAGLVTGRGMGMHRFVEPRPETAEAQVYLLYTSGGAFAASHQKALATAVAGGKGIVAVHCSSVLGFGEGGMRADETMFDLLGNKYLSHGPGYHEGRQTIEIVGGHPITEGVENFELFDEYYEFEFADENHRILATRRRVEDGADIPVLYTRLIGQGRVVYLALGHDMRAWGEPGFRMLVRRSLRWAAQLDSDSGLGVAQ